MSQHFKSLKMGDTIILKDGRITTFVEYTREPHKIYCSIVQDKYGRMTDSTYYGWFLGVNINSIAEIV